MLKCEKVLKIPVSLLLVFFIISIPYFGFCESLDTNIAQSSDIWSTSYEPIGGPAEFFCDTDAVYGSQSFGIRILSDSNTWGAWNNGSSYPSNDGAFIPVTQGKTYKVAACVKGENVNNGMTACIWVSWHTGPSYGEWITNSVDIGQLTGTFGYTLISGTVTPPAGATYARLCLGYKGKNVGAVVKYSGARMTVDGMTTDMDFKRWGLEMDSSGSYIKKSSANSETHIFSSNNTYADMKMDGIPVEHIVKYSFKRPSSESGGYGAIVYRGLEYWIEYTGSSGGLGCWSTYNGQWGYRGSVIGLSADTWYEATIINSGSLTTLEVRQGNTLIGSNTFLHDGLGSNYLGIKTQSSSNENTGIYINNLVIKSRTTYSVRTSDPAGWYMKDLTNDYNMTIPKNRTVDSDNWFTSTDIYIGDIPLRVETAGANDLGRRVGSTLQGTETCTVSLNRTASEIYILMSGEKALNYDTTFPQMTALDDPGMFLIRINYSDGTYEECIPVSAESGLVEGIKYPVQVYKIIPGYITKTISSISFIDKSPYWRYLVSGITTKN